MVGSGWFNDYLRFERVVCRYLLSEDSFNASQASSTLLKTPFSMSKTYPTTGKSFGANFHFLNVATSSRILCSRPILFIEVSFYTNITTRKPLRTYCPKVPQTFPSISFACSGARSLKLFFTLSSVPHRQPQSTFLVSVKFAEAIENHSPAYRCDE